MPASAPIWAMDTAEYPSRAIKKAAASTIFSGRSGSLVRCLVEAVGEAESAFVAGFALPIAEPMELASDDQLANLGRPRTYFKKFGSSKEPVDFRLPDVAVAPVNLHGVV